MGLTVSRKLTDVALQLVGGFNTASDGLPFEATWDELQENELLNAAAANRQARKAACRRLHLIYIYIYIYTSS